MLNVSRRLLNTAIQKPIKQITKIDINSKDLHKIFAQTVKKSCCCPECDEVRKIVNPKVIMTMEKID